MAHKACVHCCHSTCCPLLPRLFHYVCAPITLQLLSHKTWVPQTRGSRYNTEQNHHLGLVNFMPHVQKDEVPYTCMFSFYKSILPFVISAHCILEMLYALSDYLLAICTEGIMTLEKDCPKLHPHTYLLSLCPDIHFLLQWKVLAVKSMGFGIKLQSLSLSSATAV